MPTNFCISVRFLQPYFHGRNENGQPEWPPSPLRLFQAMMAAAAGLHNEHCHLEQTAESFRWLETLPPPEVVTPFAKRCSDKVRTYVPDNSRDLVAKSWSAGRDSSLEGKRTEKDVWPIRLIDGEMVHYLYSIEPNSANQQFIGFLKSVARSLTHLGWGIDMVTADARFLSNDEVSQLAGERWCPWKETPNDGLRIPIVGTFNELQHKHTAFLHRLRDGSFAPVPPLTTCRTIAYRRDFDPAPLTYAAFQLLQLDGSNMRPFDVASKTCAVAGMMRYVAGQAAMESLWDSEHISRVFYGHAKSKRSRNGDSLTPDKTSFEAPVIITQHPDDIVGSDRVAYLPLPSLESRGKGSSLVVGPIRRVLITSFGGNCRREILWTQRALSGCDLISQQTKQPIAMLATIPWNKDRMVQRYVRPATTWATVTPVILPGRDDRNLKKGERLIRKAFRQAGYSQTLAEHVHIEFRNVSYWPGADLAERFFVPAHLRNYPKFHVRIQWPTFDNKPLELPGPLCVGGGRHYGLGLFAAVD